MNYELLTLKKQELGTFTLPAALQEYLDNWFALELTYNSNALEGNTLTRQETAVVIEKGLTVAGKSIREHLEATNHVKAWSFVKALDKHNNLTEKDLLEIHGLILKGIDDANAGRYRNVSVRISGSTVILPNPHKVQSLMHTFMQWLVSKPKLHPIQFAAEAHYQLVTIHPFIDGNGRAARLLMNLLLIRDGYPPAIIRKEDRLAYINSLEKAQLGGSKEDYNKIIFQAANRSLDICLKTVKGKDHADDSTKLLKIGEVAEATNETTSTIRYWVQEGLLEVAELTKSGYQLFTADAVKRCNIIQSLKAKRLTLKEIKERLGNK
jgi:Fic family protein